MAEVTGKRRKEPRLDDFTYSFRAPDLSDARLAEINRAGRLYAERHASDPFAFGRIVCHMKRGIADPSQVAADARGVALHE